MGIFHRRKIKNAAAAIPLPDPVTNIYHQSGPNYAGAIFVTALVLPLLAIAAWLMLVYVIEQAGYHNPEAQAAKLLMLLCIGLPLLGALAWIIHLTIVGAVLEVVDRVAETRIRLAEIEAESLQHRALTAQFPTPTASRLSDDEQAFVSLLKLVMLNAYDHIAKHGDFAGQSRPWRRREALATAQRVGLNVSETQAGQVRGWLTERGVVRKNQITDKYPTMASFEILLNKEYLTPVVVGAALPRQGQAEWSIID